MLVQSVTCMNLARTSSVENFLSYGGDCYCWNQSGCGGRGGVMAILAEGTPNVAHGDTEPKNLCATASMDYIHVGIYCFALLSRPATH